MSYTHLSQDERYQIQHLHWGGFSSREISAELKRAATTISRELRRNPGDAAKYHARAAQRQSAKRGPAASPTDLGQESAMQTRTGHPETGRSRPAHRGRYGKLSIVAHFSRSRPAALR